jgi:hypothetical protein
MTRGSKHRQSLDFKITLAADFTQQQGKVFT